MNTACQTKKTEVSTVLQSILNRGCKGWGIIREESYGEGNKQPLKLEHCLKSTMLEIENKQHAGRWPINKAGNTLPQGRIKDTHTHTHTNMLAVYSRKKPPMSNQRSVTIHVNAAIPTDTWGMIYSQGSQLTFLPILPEWMQTILHFKSYKVLMLTSSSLVKNPSKLPST